MSTKPNWALAWMARYSLAMAVLAFAFHVTSWPPIWLPFYEDFPNCVAACWDDDVFAAGCVSNQSTCSVFLTTQNYGFEDSARTTWYEIRDGHFCGFPIPPTSPDASCANPTGFNLHLSVDTIGWSVPYWMMMALWLLVFGKTISGARFMLRDLLIAMIFVALFMAMLRLRIALLGILLLNLSTVMLLAHFLTSAMRSFLQTDNILWPVLFQDRVEKTPSLGS